MEIENHLKDSVIFRRLVMIILTTGMKKKVLSYHDILSCLLILLC